MKYPTLNALVRACKNDKDLNKFITITAANMKTGAIVPESAIRAGDLVKLNISAISNHPDWPTMQKRYRDFCTNNYDTVFTVEWDKKFGENPSIVCLSEDDTDPKWLFCTHDLIPIPKE